MSKKIFQFLTILSMSLFIASDIGLVRAQEKGSDQELASIPYDDVISDATLANGLIQFGREKKTPEALVTAAMILSKLPFVEVNDKDEAETKPSAIHDSEIQKLLDEALEARPGDSLLKELVKRTRESTQENSRDAFSQIKKAVSAIRKKVSIAAKQKKVVAKVKKKKGEVIAATIDQPGIVAISTVNSNGEAEKLLASGKSSVSIVAPSTGEYAITVGAGTVALDTTMMLR